MNLKCGTPGVLGMNVIKRFYYELFVQYGFNLFDDPRVSETPEWIQVLRHCKVEEMIEYPREPFKVTVKGKSPPHLAAGTLTMIPVTCPRVPSQQHLEIVLEPLWPEKGVLPEGPLVSPALVASERGVEDVPVM